MQQHCSHSVASHKWQRLINEDRRMSHIHAAVKSVLIYSRNSDVCTRAGCVRHVQWNWGTFRSRQFLHKFTVVCYSQLVHHHLALGDSFLLMALHPRVAARKLGQADLVSECQHWAVKISHNPGSTSLGYYTSWVTLCAKSAHILCTTVWTAACFMNEH